MYVALCCFDLSLRVTYVDCWVQVIDFAVDLANERVYVIELNPFGKLLLCLFSITSNLTHAHTHVTCTCTGDYDGMGTSCAMFDKADAKDRAVLFAKHEHEHEHTDSVQASASASPAPAPSPSVSVSASVSPLFEFRIETAPSPHIFKLMANEWRELMIEEGIH